MKRSKEKVTVKWSKKEKDWVSKYPEWVKEWFAPIHWCSPNGKVLIMERTKQLDKIRPKKVPYFFTDVKANNFGWIGDKFVCHDYGFLHKFIKYENKFQKAVW